MNKKALLFACVFLMLAGCNNTSAGKSLADVQRGGYCVLSSDAPAYQSGGAALETIPAGTELIHTGLQQDGRVNVGYLVQHERRYGWVDVNADCQPQSAASAP